jgi:hypothetical protein
MMADRRGRQDPFDVLCKKLTSRESLGVHVVAEACLQYATKATARGRVFDSAPVRSLGERGELARIIGGKRGAAFARHEVSAIAEVLKKSTKKNKPLAAWCVAHLISLAIDEDFTAAFIDRPPVYELKHLQAFPVVALGCNNLYGNGLSTRSGTERKQYDPSSVSGLSLWHRDRATRPFKVTIDRAGGDEFNRCFENSTLKIALIQLNESLDDLCITTLSDETAPEPTFFGVHPKDEKKQIQAATDRLEQAVTAGAGIALLPELTMTEDAEKVIGESLAGKIIPDGADRQILRGVVSGSFHHVATGQQRNSTVIRFPRADPALQPRRHSKSGAFYFSSPRLSLEATVCDPKRSADARAAIEELAAKAAKAPKATKPAELRFREDVEPSHEIRVYLGAKFSVVVLICADLLTPTFRDVLKMLSPSLVLVCNMTETLQPFLDAAHELILGCQATLASVNNPAEHLRGPVKGALIGMPLSDEHRRIQRADFDKARKGEILLFDVRGRRLEHWHGGQMVAINPVPS